MKEKGVEDAIEAVKGVNKAIGKEGYTLDIYGQVDEKYKERFEELKKIFPNTFHIEGL